MQKTKFEIGLITNIRGKRQKFYSSLKLTDEIQQIIRKNQKKSCSKQSFTYVQYNGPTFDDHGLLHSYKDEKFDEKEWYSHGQLHRDGDKPAFTSPEVVRWYKNGVLHREKGAAEIFYGFGVLSLERWYIDGKMVKEKNLIKIKNKK